ncbi:hypothetical protein AKJ09_08679 [Labilithrix luteola]|uniref:Uncharacterized protein n=1 Tax=Labilithrix luteola TaxID=1391654 RepID=A0A0K1Q877_9BACT|nr:hypothetical protein AKJ09_08679 [Labilithrix luteola]
MLALAALRNVGVAPRERAQCGAALRRASKRAGTASIGARTSMPRDAR